MPMPCFYGKQRAWLVLLVCIVGTCALDACKNECPPLSIQEGEFCRWTRDGGVAGGASGASAQAAKAAGRAGRGGRAGNSGNSGSAAGGRQGSPTVWTCMQVDAACTCVLGDGDGQDTCESPKPDCCYVYAEGGLDHCSCVPLNTPACTELFMRDGSGVAASCPL